MREAVVSFIDSAVLRSVLEKLPPQTWSFLPHSLPPSSLHVFPSSFYYWRLTVMTQLGTGLFEVQRGPQGKKKGIWVAESIKSRMAI